MKDRLDDGVVDIAVAKLRATCLGQWMFDVRFAEPIVHQAALVMLELDLDRDSSTGCGGTDSFIAFSSAGDGASTRAQAFRIRSCDRSTWREARGELVGYVGRKLKIYLPASIIPDRAFGWFIGTYPRGEMEGRDLIPNRGWSVAHFTPLPVPWMRIESAGTSAIVRWGAAPDRGTPVRSYRVSYQIAGQRYRVIDVPGRARQVRLTRLKPTNLYLININAKNRQGFSATAEGTYAPYGPPARVLDLAVASSTDVEGGYDLTWRYAPNNSGLLLKRVILSVSQDGAAPVVTEYGVLNPSSITLTDLVPGSTYRLSIAVAHDRGVGKPATVTFTVPDAPADDARE